MLNGYDVSEFQGVIDFDQLRADFLIIRDVYSTTHIDAQFARNLAQAREHTIPRMSYSFVEPAVTDPISAVNFTFAAHDVYRPGEGQACDVERDIGPSLVFWVHSWCATFAHYAGFNPIVYLNRDLLGKYDWSPVIQLGCGLWLAVGDGRPEDYAFDLHGWSVLAFKQYILDGVAVQGVSDGIDYDTFNGDAAAFVKYGAAGIVVPPQPPQPPQPIPQPPNVGYPYIIVAGDTLSGIAARCGIGWRDLWAFDGNQAVVANPDLIYAGQVVRTPCQLDPAPVPRPAVCDYVVQDGDTLSDIAATHGMTWPDLWNFADNRQLIGNPNLIYVGQTVRVPC